MEDMQAKSSMSFYTDTKVKLLSISSKLKLDEPYHHVPGDIQHSINKQSDLTTMSPDLQGLSGIRNVLDKWVERLPQMHNPWLMVIVDGVLVPVIWVFSLFLLLLFYTIS